MKTITFIFTFIILYSSICGIQVSGTQSGTWTEENNPYQIIGDVTIPTGNTLTINPGVVVQAMGVYQIIAQGNIIANATEQDSIRFVSGMMDQTTLWDGIRLENTTVQSQFSYCRIELGQYGIASVNSPVSITYCYFNKNQKGIQAFGVGVVNPATVLIDHNMIEYSQHNAILVAQNSNTSISYNEITNNGLTAQYYGAIQLSNQSAGGSCSPEIHHNHIYNNRKQGIIAWDVANANAINPAVHHNLIENNLSGIYFRQCSGAIYQNTIINNFIAGNMNSGAGLMISGALAAPCIAENIVTGNYTGFYITENANPIIGNPALNLPWAHGMNEISNNIDANNVRHSIVLSQFTNATLQIYAQNNFWDYSTAAEIAGTITDHADDPALSTVIFDPWQNHIIPIYLAGTVTLAGAENQPCKLQLVSAQSGNVLNEWTVQIGTPFQLPVEHDSLVYIVAKFSNLVEEMFYGAYGGTANPTATQIIADVQFFVGDIALVAPPNWYCKKILAPVMINGQLSYPAVSGWFVYAPTQFFWLYNDGDYIRTNRIATYMDSTYISFDPANPPIWRKVSNLEQDNTWEQFLGAMMIPGEVLTGMAHAVTGITTNVYGQSSTYDLIDVGTDSPELIQLNDHFLNNWNNYTIGLADHGIMTVRIETPFDVEQDGTLFPLITGNVWHTFASEQTAGPSYFGYTAADSLTFYWVPSRANNLQGTVYRLYDNNVLVTSIPVEQHSCSIPIPQDGINHLYTISTVNGTSEYYCENSLSLAFESNQDELIVPLKLTLYPNPFSPSRNASLNIRSGFDKAETTTISIYNLKGQKVTTLQADKSTQELSWNGKDQNGKACAAGLYQIRLTNSAGLKISKKVMLIH